MKKISYLLILTAVVLVFSGCGKKSETGQDGGANRLNKEESAGSKVVNSIKDAMGLSQKMECTYEMEIGKEKFISKVWTEGKKYRGETIVDGKKSYSLFDGEDLMYNWSEENQTGTKISIKCMEGLKDIFPEKEAKREERDLPSVEDLGEDAFDDAPEANCQPVASIDFSLPSGVVFADQCEQMKVQMENIKKMQDNFKDIKIPGGGEMPEIPEGVGL
ncbi:MAG: hypothetical protein CO140_04420 [Candidatus Moranbacteria bacterium CG_4_9_14_3_um_filter_40_7]|nr:MAG: hypothetical protein COX31_01700 [Candidatus Moranbacteria bacterium CG23_combo_of_CG06-09_8_20_14_all_40_16]PIU80831.1 MAG: hypothetical protein COS71_01255 [Candidatus Moranbacteria bacterium CG06_land_8_20_14_3_00_40_12]PJA87420.1 MAG: hypothetical protein CO140_04420 [Candidatus Moranbacteria bacterium CG_4_9_14_3_um_filter_40_7]